MLSPAPIKRRTLFLIPAILVLAAVLLTSGAQAFAQSGISETDTPATPQPMTELPRSISFNRDIRPLLSDKCMHCHGPDEKTRAVDLRFDVKESAFGDLGGYAAIVPGDAEESEMIIRILEEDEDMRMPPEEANKPLTELEIQLLQRWIDEGALWNDFWAYVPPEKYPVPDTLDKQWPTGWIDQMVLARLEEQGIQPSAPADQITLVRRLYFDLIGLPPTPEQVAAFVNDASPEAYTKTVDSLLNSKHFGERLAMYWLDLVRYADTVGYHGDQDHNISPYRDWVINALNDDMPFDQFTREQLAGDLLDDGLIGQQVASGYNRLLQTTHEGGLQPGEYRAIYAADRVRNVSAVWMGATVGCAQCHDHKYDPYKSKDFYSMAAFFADIDDEQHFKDGTNELPTKRSPEILIISDKDRVELDRLQTAAAEKKKELNELQKQKKEREAEIANAARADTNEVPVQDEADRNRDEQIATADAEYKRLVAEAKTVERRGAWTMITKTLEEPRTLRVLPRGNWMDETGPVVTPAIPEFMGEMDADGRRLTRLDLANWLTDADSNSGKLTARVFANRLWYLYMGVGISKSLDDFGGQGEAPAYPELLDNLALDFSSDWDVKRMIRQIVMSNTYRQASLQTPELRRLDPFNQLFARQSRFRLSAEMIRDNALAVAGLLNVEQIGGKSVKPYQPADYYRHLNFPKRKYAHDTDANQWRRGVYVHWQRMFLHPSLKAFDAPSREECTCERPRSNTPLAALAMLNDPIFVEAARVFAANIMTDAPATDFDSRLKFAYLWTVSREPTAEETTVLLSLYENAHAEFVSDSAAAAKLISTGQAPAAQGLDIAEHAAWTTVARAILNMSETITRN